VAQLAPPNNPVEASKQFQLAEVARQRGDRALAGQLARNVLVFRPDDFAARTFLGFQWFRGRWRLAEEIAYLDRAAAARGAATSQPAPAAAVDLPRTPAAASTLAEATRLRRQLWQRDDHAALKARAELCALAAREGLPDLRAQVEREYRRARLAIREAERSAVGIMSVRLQNVHLLGFDTVTVGLGTGTGRLMLPRTGSVSFGGTVALPLGLGN
jgi:hypothetical protein